MSTDMAAEDSPTGQAYGELGRAYAFFNDRLFAGALPPCLITMQRKGRTYGYFSGERWNSLAGAVTDEIAMNPEHFAARSAAEVLSTLAHEMAHLWQHHFGTPARRAYHNREWADKMEAIGLVPSDTGAPGGKRTGEHMSHTIREGGPFDVACQALLRQGFAISWRDRGRGDAAGKTKGKAGGRTKYTCPGCGLNAWAKPDAVLVCGACEVTLIAEEG
jgi:hypothetical protein